MLFDLRARGRRRVVKVVYASLAILMGGGLVFFGIGGDVQGGLFDAFREDTQNSAGDRVFEQRLERAEKAATARPRDPKVWSELARLRYQDASLGGKFDEVKGAFNQEGMSDLRRATQAWERHVKLTKKPDENVARLMVQAYSAADNLPAAARTLEIVIEGQSEPSPQLYTQLATIAYAAGQERKGELAGKRALALADKEDREVIQGQLDSAKQLGQQRAIEKAKESQPQTPSQGSDGLLTPGS